MKRLHIFITWLWVGLMLIGCAPRGEQGNATPTPPRPDLRVTTMRVELENPGLMDSTQQSELVIAGESISDRLSYRPVQFEEFRDDRYVAALNLNNGNSVELVYLVRAVSPGEFLVPPPQAEDMYRPQIRAIGKSPLTSITVESVQ